MTLLLSLAVGALIGFLLRRRRRFVHGAQAAMNLAVYLLLFLLGLAVGGNKTIMTGLDHLGLQALVLSLGSIAGSIAFTYLLQHRYFSEEAVDEK